MRILLVELDTNAVDLELLLLQSEGFNVYVTDSGEDAVDLAKLYDYDCIILGDVDGAHRALQQLRTARVRAPVLRLSALAMVQHITAALNAGADDFLPQPFHKDELIARINAIVRRSRGHATPRLTCGPLVIDLDSQFVTVSGQKLHPTGKEYAMLELMALRQGSLITKEMFLNHLYGGMDEPEIKIIDVFICKLRKKLGLAVQDGENLIETVWGRGYMLRGTEVGQEASLAPEIADMMDDPPVFVSRRTTQEAEAVNAKKRFGAATLVPAAGQK